MRDTWLGNSAVAPEGTARRFPLTALAAIVVVFAMAILAFLSAGARGAAPAAQEFEPAEVLWVSDGDTIYVRLADGSEEYARAIGVDTPEAVSPDGERNTPEGRAASDFTKALLPKGTMVWLQKDTRDRDKYGRLLRYIWIELPADPRNVDEVREKMLNGVLLAAGKAVAKRYPPDTAYAEIFEAIEAAAA